MECFLCARRWARCRTVVVKDMVSLSAYGADVLEGEAGGEQKLS